MLDLSLIRIDGDTQTRVELDQYTVDAYAEAYASGAIFPPVTVFFDGKDRWLADGFHRFFAAKKAGKTAILESVTPGTKRDAILFSLGANGKHGKPPSNADKRNAIERMLNDPEWTTWSDNAIAKQCHVSDKTVAARRASIFGNSEDAKPVTRTVERNGKTYEQKTANIGKVVAPEVNPAPPAAVEPDTQAPPDYSELDAAQDQISDLQADLVVARMGNIPEEDKQQAATHIAELRAEVKTLTATLKAVTLSRDSLMEEAVQMKRQMQMQRKEIDKLKNNK